MIEIYVHDTVDVSIRAYKHAFRTYSVYVVCTYVLPCPFPPQATHPPNPHLRTYTNHHSHPPKPPPTHHTTKSQHRVRARAMSRRDLARVPPVYPCNKCSGTIIRRLIVFVDLCLMPLLVMPSLVQCISGLLYACTDVNIAAF